MPTGSPSTDRPFEYQGYWLWKRKDTPNWHIYWCPTGSRRLRRKSTYTPHLEDAKHALIDFVHQNEKPESRGPEEVAILGALNDYVERTLAGRPSQGKAKGILDHFREFTEITGIDFVSELSLDVQDCYIQWRRDCLRLKGIASPSNATIQRELTVLKASLGAYRKRGYLATVPYIRSLPQPRARERFLTEGECLRLLDACTQPHLHLFVLLALHTAQRPGAILGLRTNQVRLADNCIDFLPPGGAQSNKRRPVVPITATLRPHLEAACNASRSGYVVEYEGRGVKSVKTSFNSAVSTADLEDVSPYTLRHTAATLMAKEGVPLREIAGMLGHSQTKTTELYAKHSPSYLSNAASTLDRLFGKPGPIGQRSGVSGTPRPAGT